MEMIGKVLASRYEILEKIGEGGMATVYKARCKLLNRFVAIKVLKEEYANNEDFVKRFKAEAQSAAALTHPNIVSVYDVGQEKENINYIVMELLETKTLKDYIEENGALSNEMTLKIAAQIASALEAAHNAHIVHRDIKPHNIVLNQNMVAKVTDFGIAKITNTTSATITSFGSTVGSVHYFSPEHAKGGYVDEKSDLYSLGVVMYEMATGSVPFDGDSPVSVALKQIQEEPIAPIEKNPKVSPTLNQIILRAMEKSTVARYQSATDVLKDISVALAEPNMPIVRSESFVEAGATQVIPTITDEEISQVPNIRTRQARKQSVVPKERNKDDEDNTLDDEKEELSPEDKKKKKKKIIIICVVVAILIIAILGVVGYKLKAKSDAEKKANQEIEVPDVVGKKFEDVVNEYKEQNIEIIQDKVEFSEDVEEGCIISQTPENGTKTKDKKIYVVVSKGKKMVEMTNVVGKDIKVARYELEDTLGFEVEVEEVVNEKVASGIVISQSAEKGESIPYGTKITLKVSKGDGKVSVIMPSVIGKSESEAKSKLEGLKLSVDVKYSEDKAKQNGVVLSQSYPENQSLKEGDLVSITVNKLMITKNISLDLLDLQGGAPLDTESIKLRVTASIDGGATNTVHEKTYAPTDKKASFEINGYNTAVLKIYLNDKLVKEQTVDF